MSQPLGAVRPLLAVTLGDPAGIGAEIALKSWLRRGPKTPPFFLLADPSHLSRTSESLGLKAPIEVVEPSTASSAFSLALPVVRLSQTVKGEPGRPDPKDAPATIESIERAVQYVRSGEAAGVVTNPISKAALYEVGFKHPGHTEFLGELSERFFNETVTPVMMLWSPDLAVTPVTIHIALKQVFVALTKELIIETGRIVARDLVKRFGLPKPRLAISGLNPHAGESGAMGREEIDIIAPAIEVLRGSGIDASGPWPADTMFHAAARANYDAALCMYHDQALIPIKTLAFDSGVNVTLGLPFVRTSPDHGTAYDIAGRGVANSSSLEAALALAGRLSGEQR